MTQRIIIPEGYIIYYVEKNKRIRKNQLKQFQVKVNLLLVGDHRGVPGKRFSRHANHNTQYDA